MDRREVLRSIGIGEAIIDRMLPLSADCLGEDNVLYRTCEHGIRHPVAHLERGLRVSERNEFNDAHQRGTPLTSNAQCDGCCADWEKDVVLPARKG